jgi:flagellar basal-body rod protein FlgG
MKGLYTAATGMKVQQTNVDIIANNLANVNTAGIKRTQANFQDLLYVVMKEPGALSQNGFATPSGVQIGSGAELTSTTKVFTPGVIEQTGRSLDLAIMGEGFFAVELPTARRPTRGTAGSRSTATARSDVAGLPDPPNITIPNTASKNVAIAPDGTVTMVNSDGTTSQVGQLQITRFPNDAGLRAGGGNLMYETASSGAPSQVTPGVDGTGTLGQAMLERSNVDVVGELVNLITAQRAYEINSKAIKAGDEMLQDTAGLVR